MFYLTCCQITDFPITPDQVRYIIAQCNNLIRPSKIETTEIDFLSVSLVITLCKVKFPKAKQLELSRLYKAILF